MRSLHFSQRLLLLVMTFFLLSCTCYGMSTGQIAVYAYAGALMGGTSNLNCSEFYFTAVTQTDDGTVRLSWRANPATTHGFFFYDGDLLFHDFSIRDIDDIGTTSYQINWASIAANGVEIEGREVGANGDVCTTRTTVTRPQPASNPIPALICADLALSSPLGGMANGFERFYWNRLENASSYRLNFYYAGTLLLSADAAGEATMLELDVSSSAIGGESPLTVELLAFDAAGNQCSQSYTIPRAAAPAQVAPATPIPTPTCQEDPRRAGC